MNKLTTALIISASIFVLGGCAVNEDVNPGPEQNFQQEDTSKNNEATALTEEEITEVLHEKLGTEDPETGFTYSFSIVGEVMIDEEPFYYGRWSWLVEDEQGMATHQSLLTEFFVSQDGEVMYTGTYDQEEEKVALDDGENFFEK
ncbi:hypothetical protein ACPWSR_06790 [Alloiococcus sp. CFN-8]|uniref:hypothetical protein n=1 Tax=Alloiococcus sp. CFN-8 TaxID=3416081 RepID=UPI003CECB114